MSDLWQEDVTLRWLADDEDYPEILGTIREFIEYRATKPPDETTAGVHDMSGVFRPLSIEDESSTIDEMKAAPD